MIAKKIENISVVTPEFTPPSKPILMHSRQKNQHYPPAGFGSRFIAIFIDGFLSQVFTGLMMAAIGLVDAELVAQDDILIFAGVTLLVSCSSMFFVVCVPLMFMAQTPGKKLMGLKVVSMVPGDELGIGQIIGRETFWKPLSGMMMCIGYLMALWDKEKRAWHDKRSNTRVVAIR